MPDNTSRIDNHLPTPIAALALASHTPGQTRVAIDSVLEYAVDATSEFVFLIHIADSPGLTLIEESLLVEPHIPYRCHTDAASGNRFMRLQAEAGTFKVIYRAIVDRSIESLDPDTPEVAVHDMPADILPYLSPTRYCESDELSKDAQALFGGLAQGLRRVQAISDWVQNNITFRTGAHDVLVPRRHAARRPAARQLPSRTGASCRTAAGLPSAFSAGLLVH